MKAVRLMRYIDKFMAAFPFEGLTFDDISLVVQYADFRPHDTDISSNFSRNIKLNIPFVDTRHWNIELAFNGVHFTESGHHTFVNRLIEYLR